MAVDERKRLIDKAAERLVVVRSAVVFLVEDACCVVTDSNRAYVGARFKVQYARHTMKI